MEDGLSIALTFLSYTCIILFTVITVFLIMLIKDLMDLAKSYKNLSETIQKEINPTLEEIKKALVSINGLATGVDKQINAVKSSFGTAYKLAFNATSKLKGTAAAIIGGVIAGYKMFSKKNK